MVRVTAVLTLHSWCSTRHRSHQVQNSNPPKSRLLPVSLRRSDQVPASAGKPKIIQADPGVCWKARDCVAQVLAVAGLPVIIFSCPSHNRETRRLIHSSPCFCCTEKRIRSSPISAWAVNQSKSVGKIASIAERSIKLDLSESQPPLCNQTKLTYWSLGRCWVIEDDWLMYRLFLDIQASKIRSCPGRRWGTKNDLRKFLSLLGILPKMIRSWPLRCCKAMKYPIKSLVLLRDQTKIIHSPPGPCSLTKDYPLKSSPYRRAKACPLSSRLPLDPEDYWHKFQTLLGKYDDQNRAQPLPSIKRWYSQVLLCTEWARTIGTGPGRCWVAELGWSTTSAAAAG